MRIKTLFGLTMAGVGMFAVAASTWTVLTYWKSYQSAQSAAGIVRTMSAASRYIEKMSVERGTHSQLLIAATTPTEKSLAGLRQVIAETDAVIEEVQRSSASLSPDLNAVVKVSLEQLSRHVASTRAMSESEYLKPKDQRPADIGPTIVREASKSSDAAKKLLDDLEVSLFSLEPSVARIMSVAKLSNDLRDTMGRRSTFITQYVGSGARFTPQISQQAATFTGHGNANWATLKNTIALLGEVPILKAALELTETKARGEGEKRYLEMIVAANEGKKPEISVAEWWEWTQSMLKSTLATRDAAAIEAINLTDGMERRAFWNKTMAAAGAAAILVFVTLLGILSNRRFVLPLVQLTQVIDGVARGKFDISVPSTKRRDEIGLMAQSIETLRQSGLDAQVFAEKSLIEKDAATNALRMDLAGRFKTEVEGSLLAFGHTAEAVRLNSEKSAGLAQSMSDRTSIASQEVTELAEHVNSIAASAEELAAAIASVSRQAEEASAITVAAASETRIASSRVAGLSEISGRIDDFVGLIKTVADQTNLLALNATIEAARAGEAGRGFAVVAAEVKNLAQQTTQATDQIAKQTSEMRAAIGGSIEAIGNIADIVPEIERASVEIAAAMVQQRMTTDEMSQNVLAVSIRASSVQMATNKFLEEAVQTSRAADEMVSSAKELGQQRERIGAKTAEFVGQIAAAG
jgi:methyl-accepting chemotaxis protein